MNRRSWKPGDRVTIVGTVEAHDGCGVQVRAESPDLMAVNVVHVYDKVLRRADDGAADAIRERDVARAERDVLKGRVKMLETRLECTEKAERASYKHALAHDDTKRRLDVAIRLIGERMLETALREAEDGGER